MGSWGFRTELGDYSRNPSPGALLRSMWRRRVLGLGFRGKSDGTCEDSNIDPSRQLPHEGHSDSGGGGEWIPITFPI